MTMTTHRGDLALSFATGAVVALIFKTLWDRKKKDRSNAGACTEGDDLSLFYGDQTQLTTVTDRRKFLPKEIYGDLVRDTVVCCVDLILVRQQRGGAKKECLLVLRSSEPAKGIWWLPGGRLLKGETFFDAAVRKAKQEAGIDKVRPIQVLGVWNTFFPRSSWDTPASQGTQTVNPIVLVEMGEEYTEVKLDNQSEEYRWIGLDPDEAEKNGEDRYVLAGLRRLKAWNPSYI